MKNVKTWKQIYMALKLFFQKMQSFEEILILLLFAILDKLEKANCETILYHFSDVSILGRLLVEILSGVSS